MSLGKEVADGLEQKKSLELQADWEMLPEHVFEIFHRFQHLVEELLTTFIAQMKSAIIGNKLLILPAALKKSLGELGRCIFLKILAYCNTVIVFFGRL